MKPTSGFLIACVAAALKPPPATAQPVATLDLSDHTVETLIPPEFDGDYFYRIGPVVVNDDGAWVLDTGHTTVFRFDSTGRLVASFGREGSGPGEFVMPGGMRVDSVVTVSDPRQARVSQFTLDGEHLDTWRTSGPLGSLGGLAVLRNGVNVYVPAMYYSMSASGIEGDPRSHVAVGFAGSERTDTIASWHGGSVMWASEGAMSLFSPGFGASGAWTTMGDSAIVVADGATGAIRVFTVPDPLEAETDTPQLPVESLTMGVVGRAVTQADRDRAEDELRRDNERVGGQVTLGTWPSHWSVATALLVSDDGNVWARGVVPGDERQHWTEVDLGGPLRRQVILPEGFSLRAAGDARLYGVASDEMGVQRVAFLDRR